MLWLGKGLKQKDIFFKSHAQRLHFAYGSEIYRQFNVYHDLRIDKYKVVN